MDERRDNLTIPDYLSAWPRGAGEGTPRIATDSYAPRLFISGIQDSKGILGLLSSKQPTYPSFHTIFQNDL